MLKQSNLIDKKHFGTLQNNNEHKLLPAHPGVLLIFPSPENPGLQVQLNDPVGVLEQSAFASHTGVMMAHSSKSERKFANFMHEYSEFNLHKKLPGNSLCLAMRYGAEMNGLSWDPVLKF